MSDKPEPTAEEKMADARSSAGSGRRVELSAHHHSCNRRPP